MIDNNIKRSLATPSDNTKIDQKYIPDVSFEKRSILERNTGINQDKLKEIRDDRYPEENIIIIRFLYITFSFIWILIIYSLDLYAHSDYPGKIILSLPLVIFLINFFTCEYLDERSETSLYPINYLTIGLLMMFPLINWVTKSNLKFAIEKPFPQTMFLGLILILISVIDIWVPPKWLSIILHYKSSLVTISLILILHGFYSFYSYGFDYWKLIIDS